MQLFVRVFFLVSCATGWLLYLMPDILGGVATPARSQQRTLMHSTPPLKGKNSMQSYSKLSVTAENLIDFNVNGRQYHLPLHCHDSDHVFERARLFCVINGAALGIGFADREKQCVSSVANYILGQIRPGMILQMEFSIQTIDNSSTRGYEVLFDQSINSGADVAASLCMQKSADMALASEEELQHCINAVQESLSVFTSISTLEQDGEERKE